MVFSLIATVKFELQTYNTNLTDVTSETRKVVKEEILIQKIFYLTTIFGSFFLVNLPIEYEAAIFPLEYDSTDSIQLHLFVLYTAYVHKSNIILFKGAEFTKQIKSHLSKKLQTDIKF